MTLHLYFLEFQGLVGDTVEATDGAKGALFRFLKVESEWEVLGRIGLPRRVEFNAGRQRMNIASGPLYSFRPRFSHFAD